MLSRSQRLSVQQFNVVMIKGRISQSAFFSARTLKAEGQTRIAAVAGQKIAKTAVSRNALRRRIYEAVAPLYSKLATGFHVIIFAKSPALPLEPHLFASEIQSLFVKAGLMR